jgi:hypothetical protein
MNLEVFNQMEKIYDLYNHENDINKLKTSIYIHMEKFMKSYLVKIESFQRYQLRLVKEIYRKNHPELLALFDRYYLDSSDMNVTIPHNIDR